MLTKSGDDLAVGQTKYITISKKDARVIYSFVPESSGYYTFSSISSGKYDTCAWLYDVSWNQMDYNDDVAQGYLNFSIRHQLDAGVRYYFVAKFLSPDQAGSFTVRLQR